MSKWTYHRRIQLSFFLLIFLPLLAVSFISYRFLSNEMVEKVKLSNDNVINVINEEIERTIDDISFASHFLVNDMSFKQQLEQFSNVERLTSFETYQTFREIEEGLSLISSKTLNNNIHMYLINNKNFIVSASPSARLEAIQQNSTQLLSEVNKGLAENLQWLGMANDPNTESSYYIARAIFDTTNKEIVSTLLIGISESYFVGLFKSIEFGNVALFDAEGEAIFNNKQLHVEKALVDSSLRLESKIEKTNWTLVYETTRETLTGQISRTFITGIISVSVLFLVFLLSSMIVAKRLYRPIFKLQRVVRQVGEGNLDSRIEVKGNDDLAALSRSINTMLDQIQQLIIDIEFEQEQKKIMELEALFMQIRPHFLINTLNSIKCSLILQQDRLHSQVIDSLMSLLRYYLKFHEETTLQEECKLLSNYLEVMKIRSEQTVELHIDLQPEVKQLIIPKLILQPVVENAIVHGLLDIDNAKITVTATIHQGLVQIMIEDNGVGMDEEKLEQLNDYLTEQKPHDLASEPNVFSQDGGVGLINVINRLRLTFGSSAVMKLYAGGQGGVLVIIQFLVPEQQPLLLQEDRHV
ncbi:sensor histidine kinase [Paenibacillus yanchengensis]|uniref:Sensor histidine kinase n=1 Tax=Paenibacillus yanchengensis TaxID=2035833 RepID=A0ABW4YHF4_9BACL